MLHHLPDADPRAAALLRDTAAFFGRTDSLATRIVSDSALASGTFRMACSPRVDVAVIEGFRFAPLWPPDMTYELVREIAGLARSHLAMDDACVVCELGTGPGATGESIAATRSRPPRYFLVPTVPSPTAYSFAVPSDLEAGERLEDLLAGPLAGPFGWIVFARSKRLGLAEFEPREAVDEIVATVAEVIVPALDGQGALLWAPG